MKKVKKKNKIKNKKLKKKLKIKKSSHTIHRYNVSKNPTWGRPRRPESLLKLNVLLVRMTRESK